MNVASVKGASRPITDQKEACVTYVVTSHHLKNIDVSPITLEAKGVASGPR